VLTCSWLVCLTFGAEHKLFVGMISKTTTEEDLRTLFGPYGNVQEVFILHDTSGQSKGCGFVRYDTRDQAVAAISALNGTHYMQVRSRSKSRTTHALRQR